MKSALLTAPAHGAPQGPPSGELLPCPHCKGQGMAADPLCCGKLEKGLCCGEFLLEKDTCSSCDGACVLPMPDFLEYALRARDRGLLAFYEGVLLRQALVELHPELLGQEALAHQSAAPSARPAARPKARL